MSSNTQRTQACNNNCHRERVATRLLLFVVPIAAAFARSCSNARPLAVRSSGGFSCVFANGPGGNQRSPPEAQVWRSGSQTCLGPPEHTELWWLSGEEGKRVCAHSLKKSGEGLRAESEV